MRNNKTIMNLSRKIALALVFVLPFMHSARADMQYLTPEQFLTENLAPELPKPNVLWLTKDIAKQVEQITGHAPILLRQRYWRVGDKTAWILEEIGKEEPITAGFIVTADKITQVRVLTYRESRGWEVRYPAFLKQYSGAGLQDDDALNRNIDGISGATLSVNAMNRMARLALYFDRISKQESH